MSLGAPWMLLLMSLVVLAGGLMRRARRLQRDAACRLKGITPPTASVRLGRRDWLTLAALGSIVLALARPQWNPRPYGVERRARDLVLALDVSRSMLAADVFPSRLEAARIAIHEALPALAGQRIALVTFAGSAAVPVPLTLDHEFVRYMLDRADPAEMDLGSTSLQAAIEKAAGTVLADAADGGRDLVVFTDGEDHLSNFEKIADVLTTCDANVLIIGLGDPVGGARVPAVSDAERWMQYKDTVVVSRLDEDLLTRLAARSPHVTYHASRTRPFDLVPLYQKLVAGATGDVVAGELREVRYTEGYPYLLALAVALWLAVSPWRLPVARSLVILVLLLPGCGRPGDDAGEVAFRAKFRQGDELLKHAQEQSAVDASAARSLFVDAREAFLRAALLRPGDRESARRITAVTRRLHEVDAAIEKELAEETQRRDKLDEIIRRLETLTLREARLSEQSRLLLRRRPQPPSQELNGLAQPASTEQKAVHEETARALESLTLEQDTLQEILKQAYGGTTQRLPTELDPVVELLTSGVTAQQVALDGLVAEAVQWPQVNVAFHVAAGRMQMALESLRSLLPPATDPEDDSQPPIGDNNGGEDVELPEADGTGNKAKPTAPGDFDAVLSLDSLPLPNYTSADILAEEAANQQRRARQKAARAGAKVEKNW